MTQVVSVEAREQLTNNLQFLDSLLIETLLFGDDSLSEAQIFKSMQLYIKHTKRFQGRIQDFKLGGAHLNKLHRAEGGAKIVGVFRVKNHDFTPKNHIFSNFREGARRVQRAGCSAPSSGSVPVRVPLLKAQYLFSIENMPRFFTF